VLISSQPQQVRLILLRVVLVVSVDLVETQLNSSNNQFNHHLVALVVQLQQQQLLIKLMFLV